MNNRLLMGLAVLLVAAGIGGFYYFSDLHLLVRAGMVLAGVVAGLLVALQSEAGQRTWEFAKTSRVEIRKVVWPTRRETAQTTLVVLGLAILVGLYVWAIDSSLGWIVRSWLKGGA